MNNFDPSEPIAIVGMGGVFPGSKDIPSFWDNILNKVDSVIEVPIDRWDWRLYYDPNPSAPDKTYSKIGGFVRDFQFDPLKLRIPLPVATQMDMSRKWPWPPPLKPLLTLGMTKSNTTPSELPSFLEIPWAARKKN